MAARQGGTFPSCVSGDRSRCRGHFAAEACLFSTTRVQFRALKLGVFLMMMSGQSAVEFFATTPHIFDEKTASTFHQTYQDSGPFLAVFMATTPGI